MLNSSHIDMVFKDNVFKEYLCTQNISVNELKQHLHEAIINVLENTIVQDNNDGISNNERTSFEKFEQ